MCWSSRWSSCPRARWTVRSSPARIPPAPATPSRAGCRECRIRFSLGYAINQTVREQILALPEDAWTPAVNQDGAATRRSMGHRAHRPGRPRLLARRAPG